MALVWFDNYADLLEKKAEHTGFIISEMYEGPFPLKTEPTVLDTGEMLTNLELVNAKIFKVSVGEDNYAVVLLCRAADKEGDAFLWSIYCGDTQLEGQFWGYGKKLAEKLRKEGGISILICNALEDERWVGKIPDQAGCGFFRMQERSGRICAHTQAVLNLQSEDDLKGMASTLQAWLEGDSTDLDSNSNAALSPEEEAFYDAAFIQHVLLAGERGSGKSYLARQAADKYDAVYLEMQMHPSMEPWEFRAHDRAWNGKVYTVLGKLAEAVYWIQQGKRVVLCMDEFLNMNPMYTTVINSPLTLTANDTYLIETGRIIDMGDGVGRVETVEVPSDMLWVVATTNIGARYNLDKMPPSVRARFQIILMNTNAERTASILEKNLKKYEMPKELANMFHNFIERCQQAVLENTLDEEATTRLACNVIRAVHKKALRDKKKYKTLTAWLPAIKKQVMREVAQVVNFDTGPLDVEQQEVYGVLVEACFRPGKSKQ